MKKFSLVLILCLLFLLQGCMVFLASLAGYRETTAKYTPLYHDYCAEQEMRNLERINNGLASEPVKEYKDWLKEQPLKANEIKVLKIYKVISPQEAKELQERAVE